MLDRVMSKQEIIDELSRLYRLRQEGLHVRTLIAQLEEKLCEKCDEELDSKEVDEKN